MFSVYQKYSKNTKMDNSSCVCAYLRLTANSVPTGSIGGRKQNINMWAAMILLASTLFTVSHAQETMLRLAVVGEDVLLPCPCQDNTVKYLVWQIGENVVVASFPQKYNMMAADNFQNRTRLYYPAERDNCSLLLSNVTMADNQTYSCFFKKPEVFKVTVSLLVVAAYGSSSSCTQRGDAVGSDEYRCQASGGYPQGRVSWLLDGRVVQGTRKDQHSQDPLTHLYNVTSTLNITLDSPRSSLECVIEYPILQANVSEVCRTAAPGGQTGDMDKKSIGFVILLSSLVLVGMVVVLLKIRHRGNCFSRENVI